MRSILTFSLILFSTLAFGKNQSCTYEFDVENSKVEGTGYKFTEKTGVTASFPGFELNKQSKAESPKALLDGLVVTVNLVTIDSGNALRDKNMRETLLTGILGDSVATVTVKKVTDKSIETEFKINEKTQKIDFKYSLKDSIMTAKGSFDVLKFAMGEQVAALKKRCGSLHTGADGKSVTWTEFDVAVTAMIKKNCQ